MKTAQIFETKQRYKITMQKSTKYRRASRIMKRKQKVNNIGSKYNTNRQSWNSNREMMNKTPPLGKHLHCKYSNNEFAVFVAPKK